MNDTPKNQSLMHFGWWMGGQAVRDNLNFASQKLIRIFDDYQGRDYFVTMTGFALWINIGGPFSDCPEKPRRVGYHKEFGRLSYTVDIPASDWVDLPREQVLLNYAARLRKAFPPLLAWCRRNKEIVSEEKLLHALEEGLNRFLIEPDPAHRPVKYRRATDQSQ
jgi:hypothetical protein